MDRPDVRVSDAERDHAVSVLRDAAAEGRLTFEELADRIGGASEATTRGELERVTADLPEPAAATQVVASVNASSLFGDVKRSGAWTVPAQSRWRSGFGDVVLDLREARVSAPVVTIDAATVFGDVDLLVPEGVLVEVNTRTLFGDVRQEAGDAAPADAPRIMLVGGTVFGDVRVRARRLRERLAARFLGGA